MEEGINSSNSVLNNNGSWYNDFADKLLSENFLLTALEFYSELVESGKELPKLKNFFLNPSNFEQQTINRNEIIHSSNLPRSSSQATLDSLDLTRYSEDGERSTDDRVAVLEFELRKAKETINALRINLTEAAELDKNKLKTQEENVKHSQFPYPVCNPIRPHEQRALNFLINEYLLLHGYKLTSITFADENEKQDFEDWDDVGLNSARPMELLYLYREGLRGTNSSMGVEKKDFECQVTLYDEVKQNLQINELESEVARLSNKINVMAMEYSKKNNESENEKIIEVESHRSMTPDPEYFEMIETIKSNDGSETRSDKSNGDWTKIGDKFRDKKGSIDLKSDSQSNFESISIDDKGENISGGFVENEETFVEFKCKEKSQDKVDDEDNPVSDNMAENSTDSIFETSKPDVSDDDGGRPRELNAVLKSDKMTREFLDVQSAKRPLPEKFKTEIFKHCDTFVSVLSEETVSSDRLKKEDLEEFTIGDAVAALSKSLPKIIPNVILNKREEIIPLLVLSICLNPAESERDKLFNLLFNLKKKPQPEERSVILRSLINIAQLKGSDMTENEILPQCWEQLGHKYVERRMLAAESCFALAPYVSEAIRNSLIISIVQQLLQDREESIRKASVNILALLIALISHEDKYNQVVELCFQVLNEESAEVIESARKLLFPTLAQWSFSLRKIQSDLYCKLLDAIRKEKNLNCVNILEILLPYLIMEVATSERILQFSENHNPPPPAKRQEFCHLCKGLCDPALFYSGSLVKIMGTFDAYALQANLNESDWPELVWIKNVLVSGLLEAGDRYFEDGNVLKGLMSTLRYLSLGLGRNITSVLIKPFLLEKLMECENAVVSGQEYKCAIIPLYLVGVLSTFPEELQEMSNTLRRFICALPLCGVSLLPLKLTFEILSQYQSWQILLLDAIWEGVVHQRPLVRCGSASLLQAVIPNIPEILVNTKILPALVTLTSDPELSVKTAAVPALGLLANVKEKVIHDKVHMTFQTLLQESISMENHTLLNQLIKTISSIYENTNSKFREEVLFPQLSGAAAMAFQTKRKDLIGVLTDVYSVVTFSQIQVPPQCASLHLLPGLRNLDLLCSQFHSAHSERIGAIIKDVERRFGASPEIRAKSSVKSPTDGKRLGNMVSPNVVVEDVRTRVNKIFNAKPHTLQNVSGIFKKKS